MREIVNGVDLRDAWRLAAAYLNSGLEQRPSEFEPPQVEVGVREALVPTGDSKADPEATVQG